MKRQNQDMAPEFIGIRDDRSGSVGYVRKTDVVSIVLVVYYEGEEVPEAVTLPDFMQSMEDFVAEMESEDWVPDNPPLTVAVCYRDVVISSRNKLRQVLVKAFQWGLDILQWLPMLGATPSDMELAYRYAMLVNKHTTDQLDESIHGAVPPMAPGENVQ